MAHLGGKENSGETPIIFVEFKSRLRGRRVRILIVEDDPRMALVLRDALEKKSHRIVLASTGTEGLEIARSHPFESILLDVMLPGIDGFAVARSLRDAHVSTP